MNKEAVKPGLWNHKAQLHSAPLQHHHPKMTCWNLGGCPKWLDYDFKKKKEKKI